MTLLSHKQPWSLVREWLHGLGREVASGIADGSLPRLNADHVWLSPTGRAWLLEFPAPPTRRHEVEEEGERVRDFAAAQRFLYDVAERALSGPRPAEIAPGLPLHARQLLNQLRDSALNRPEELVSLAERLVRGSAASTRGRRILQLALPGVPILWSLMTALPILTSLYRRGSFGWVEMLGFILREIVLPVLIVVGVISTICAFVFRDGPSFRALRIAIVTADGQPVSRWRAVSRAVAAWGPIWLLSIGIVNDTALIINPAVSAFLRGPVPAPALLALLLGGIGIAILTPERGVPDRLVGTYLVPSE